MLHSRLGLVKLAAILIVLDFAVVMGILFHAKSKSQGGAFSVELLSKGVPAGPFRSLAIPLGFVSLALLVIASLVGGQLLFVGLAWIVMLVGFFAFRRITHNLPGSIGLPR